MLKKELKIKIAERDYKIMLLKKQLFTRGWILDEQIEEFKHLKRTLAHIERSDELLWAENKALEKQIAHYRRCYWPATTGYQMVKM